jgi:peptidoglycan DL-endopeptidase CwlO
VSPAEVDLHARAHALFAGHPGYPVFATPGAAGPPPAGAGVLVAAHGAADAAARARLAAAGRVDSGLLEILRAAHDDHDRARTASAALLAAARADAVGADSPVAARELLRRRVIRLRAQRVALLAARGRARRRRAALLALRYRLRPDGVGGRRAQTAVRAALSRLGSPYVWGATGPNRFDCSGLVQWAYARAGVPLRRTTYEQINDGIPVPRSQVRPGDLVFPHAGHVQMAIGGNLVVEAPHAGASVRVAPLGSDVVIRRPL